MRWWETRLLAQEGEGGGGGSAGGAGSAGEGAGAGDAAGGGGEGAATGDVAAGGEPGAEGKGDAGAGGAGKPPTRAKPPESVPYSVFSEKLSERDRRIEQMQQTLDRLQGDLETVRPPQKHPLETWIESLPKGVGPTKEQLAEDPNARGDDAYEFAVNARLMLPILRAASEHMAPTDYAHVRSLVSGLAVMLDRTRFETEQLASMLVERDAEGNIVKDNRPPGLKHLDRIEKHRQAEFEKSGKKKLLRYGDSFKQVEAQLRAEAEAEAAKAEQLRQEGGQRTERELTQRRGATGAPGSAAAAPHRGKAAGPRSFDQLEKDVQAGKDYAIR